jgi:hypothetical protein
MTFETIVIDDVLPKEYADKIERIHISGSFPWTFNVDMTLPAELRTKLTDYINTPGFTHASVHLKKQVSQYIAQFAKIVYYTLQKINYTKAYEIIVCRSFMLLPTPKVEEFTTKHIDTETPHLVILYYVNDTDGDTYFFGKEKDSELVQRVSPRKNRAVIFDGANYHASSLPTNKHRIVMNFNLEIENDDL